MLSRRTSHQRSTNATQGIKQLLASFCGPSPTPTPQHQQKSKVAQRCQKVSMKSFTSKAKSQAALQNEPHTLSPAMLRQPRPLPTDSRVPTAPRLYFTYVAHGHSRHSSEPSAIHVLPTSHSFPQSPNPDAQTQSLETVKQANNKEEKQENEDVCGVEVDEEELLSFTELPHRRQMSQALEREGAWGEVRSRNFERGTLFKSVRKSQTINTDAKSESSSSIVIEDYKSLMSRIQESKAEEEEFEEI